MSYSVNLLPDTSKTKKMLVLKKNLELKIRSDRERSETIRLEGNAEEEVWVEWIHKSNERITRVILFEHVILELEEKHFIQFGNGVLYTGKKNSSLFLIQKDAQFY